MKNVVFTWVCCVWGLLFILSCSHDTYDYNQAKADYDNAFSNNVMNGDSIDPAQTWNASVMSTLNVSVNLDAGATYRVCVMTDNPLSNTSATVLDEKNMTSGTTSSFRFAKPMALRRVYVIAINSKNRYDVYSVEMADTLASIALGGNTSSSTKNKTRAVVQNVSTVSSDYQRPLSDFIAPSVITGHTYYDISTMDAADYGKMDLYLYWPDSRYKYGDGKHYYIPEGVTINANLGYSQQKDENCVILVKGTWEVPSDISFDNNQKIYVSETGHIIFDGNASFTSRAQLINLGTIQTSSGKISVTNWNLSIGDVYNSGTMSLNSGGMVIAGNNSQIYNCGTMTMEYMQVGGNCTLTNMGTVKAKTSVQGDYTTVGQYNGASNAKIINGCHLAIDALGVKQLILCDNSRIDCSTGIYTGGGQGDNYLYLGKYAVVKVGDWQDNGGHIYGSDDATEPSVFQFTGTVAESNGGAFETKGYVFFDGSFPDSYHVNIIRTGDANEYNKGIITYHMTHFTTESTSTISIPKGECTGAGYNPDNNPPTPPVVTPSTYYYAYEDLGSIGDYDFNDVVIAVKYPIVVGTQKNAEIYLVAAGGTLTTSVSYGSTVICDEVHSKFGVGTSTMVNTTAKTLPEQLLYTITNTPDGFDASNLNISIYVNGYVSAEISPNVQSGKIPQMIKVPSPWKWPKETTNISDAYSTSGHSFGAWGSNYSTNTAWYQYPVSGRVVE